MFFLHPALLCCSLLLSSAYYLTIHRRRGLKFLAAMIPLFVVLAAVNPLFNPNGQTVLFVYLGGRPYTLEALIYGAAIAAMFISILIWFACYNAVMTSDKFLYIFGRTAPAISLVLSMILRLVPGFQRKAGQIAGARRCIPLKVSGPFHTSLLAPAGEALRERFATERFGAMRVPVLFNTLGREVSEAELDAASTSGSIDELVPALLVRQVQSAVRMEDTIHRLAELGVDRVIEIGPGRVLSGLVRKTEPGIACASVETVSDIESLAS